MSNKELKSITQIFDNKIFRIPDYQRGYAWRETQLIDFWEDLLTLDDNRKHYTGVLSIRAVPENVWKTWKNEEWLLKDEEYKAFYIVDGQQRLTTVSILLQCIFETAAKYSSEKEEIYFGSKTLSKLIEQFIVVMKPPQEIVKTYLLGYESDNPSYKFLIHRIYDEPYGGTINETFYTLNLENAKKFFSKQISNLVDNHGIEVVKKLFNKLTRQLMFNLYELDDDFDVYVAFETMNNRGKKLSDLELLKNRLIYLTTLYPDKQVSDDVKFKTRSNINDAWKEVYYQLGRNKSKPLSDDEFLRAHWIMYFKYSRKTGKDYIHFLLDEYFSPKKIFDKIEIQTENLSMIEEISSCDQDEDDADINEEEDNENETIKSMLQIKDINDYVRSLQEASTYWYDTNFPSLSKNLSLDEKIWMDKLNRIGVGSYRPLIMSCFVKTTIGDESRIKLLKAIERFIFIAFRVVRASTSYTSSIYSREARNLYKGETTIDEILESFDRNLDWVFDNGFLMYNSFKDFISKKFKSSGKGFYGWKDIYYFLYEYEEKLREIRNNPKISWENFIIKERDRVSIEHIYPQNASNDYWKEKFGSFSEDQRKVLNGSLGNLLPLSAIINSSLQNYDFPTKKNVVKDSNGETIRNGYSNGSLSELEVSAYDKWTADEIKERGLKLLTFMEKRWNFKFPSEQAKLEILHLTFLEE